MDTPNIEQTAQKLAALQQQICHAVIGQQHIVREIMIALIAGGHVLIEGVPGLGKTLLVRALTKAVGGKFKRIQFTPDLMPADISGHAMFDQKANEFRIRRGPIFSHFVITDEINRAPAKTQAALLEAMQEKQVTIEGQSFALESPFMVLATQNPIDQEGTYPLPLAQLDRFLVKILIDYPSLQEETDIVSAVTDGLVGDALNLDRINTILSAQDIVEFQKQAASLITDPAVIDYGVRIVHRCRDWRGVETGPGTRGSIALLRTAKAMALLNGSTFVTPDDIKSVAVMVLRHRIQLSADLEIEGRQPDDVIADILQAVDSPRQ
ncbi:MAG: MoxR family ATPase [Gammaproteobacteria bacterium]|nr:MoxR family ATPase [Gammaproteobacteria bacterium]